MSLLESIVSELQVLPEPQLMQVASYLRALRPSDRERQRAVWAASTGCMPGAEGQEFERLVREGADRIDVSSD